MYDDPWRRQTIDERAASSRATGVVPDDVPSGWVHVENDEDV